MRVTAYLLFRERAMMMILSFLYIVFCKRAQRLSFFEQILPRAGGENFFSYMGFRERARRFFCCHIFPRTGIDILSEVQASTMQRASRTSHGEGPGSVPELQKKNFQKHEQRFKKKRDMQVTADLLFRERAMMMIFSFLYIVFCKRAKRLSVFEQILPRAGGGNFFSYCLLYTSPSPRDLSTSRMPSSA